MTARPAAVGEGLTVGFFGSAYPHKGPQPAGRGGAAGEAEMRVRIHGEVPGAFAEHLRSLDAPRRRRAVRRVLARGAPGAAGRRGRGRDPVAVVGLRAADGGRVPGRARAGAGRAHGRDRRLRADGVTGCCSTAATAPAWPPRSTGWPASRACSSGCRRASGPARFAGLRGRAGALLRRRAALATRAHGRRSRCAGAATRAQPTSLSTIKRDVCDHLEGDGHRRGAGAAPGDAPTPPCRSPPRSRCATSGRSTSGRRRPAAGRDPAVGVRRDPGRVGGADRSATWTRCGCRASTSREMYLDAGVDPERVHVVGRTASTSRPSRRTGRAWSWTRPRLPLPVRRRADPPQGRPTCCSRPTCDAFAGRDDVSLVIKDFGADAIYPGSDREPAARHAAERRAAADRVPGRRMTAAELAACTAPAT